MVKYFLQLLLLISAFTIRASALDFKSGDLILESLPCHLCSLIEAEEKSHYSHMGVLTQQNGDWVVLESWGNVKITSLSEFLKRRKKDSDSLVLRANQKITSPLMNANTLLDRFKNTFAGLSYDPEFLWNNFDEKGEKLYCSELVAKLLQPFLSVLIPTKPMHFEVSREIWLKYFHGNPPDGAPGISPGDFEHSPLFYKVGTI